MFEASSVLFQYVKERAAHVKRRGSAWLSGKVFDS